MFGSGRLRRRLRDAESARRLPLRRQAHPVAQQSRSPRQGDSSLQRIDTCDGL